MTNIHYWGLSFRKRLWSIFPWSLYAFCTRNFSSLFAFSLNIMGSSHQRFFFLHLLSVCWLGHSIER